ncbi:MAG: hypothetical protein RLZ12_855 [Bacillota bacterium]
MKGGFKIHYLSTSAALGDTVSPIPGSTPPLFKRMSPTSPYSSFESMGYETPMTTPLETRDSWLHQLLQILSNWRSETLTMNKRKLAMDLLKIDAIYHQNATTAITDIEELKKSSILALLAPALSKIGAFLQSLE